MNQTRHRERIHSFARLTYRATFGNPKTRYEMCWLLSGAAAYLPRKQTRPKRPYCLLEARTSTGLNSLGVRYPVASLASTCFALLQLELARSKCGGMRHCAASRPRHEGISTVLQTLPTDYRAAGKQGTKNKGDGSNCEPGFGPEWNFELDTAILS